MKSHTPRFPAERRAARAGVACATVVTVALSGCVATLGGEFRNHPSPLVAAWVDVAKSSAADTSLWLLGASGEDGSQHVRLLGGSDSASHRYALTPPHRYGYWYLRGSFSDSAGRAICFTNRPGRSAPSCLPFTLDTVMRPQGPRTRLRVYGYAGAHSTGERVLLAREP